MNDTQYPSQTFSWNNYNILLIEAEALDCDVPTTAVHIYNQESYSYDDFT